MINNLKMKELSEIETLSGYNMDEWETCPKVKLTMAITYVMAKKDKPELTWEEVENMTLDEMQGIMGEEFPKVKVS
jgi:hypothetical protein